MADTVWPGFLPSLVDGCIAAEFTTLTNNGSPVTDVITPYLRAEPARITTTTSIVYPAKADRARANSRVAMLFSSNGLETQPVGAPVVLVQGHATVRDADLAGNAEGYVDMVSHKLPGVLADLPDWYRVRIFIDVIPARVLSWPTGDLEQCPTVWESTHAAAPSDPAPRGARKVPPMPSLDVDWRELTARALSLSNPVLSVVDATGFPYTVPVTATVVDGRGFAVDVPKGAGIVPRGAASLVFHRQRDTFTWAEAISFVGEVSQGATATVFSVRRAMTGIWTERVARGEFDGLAGFVEAECHRRGQRLPPKPASFTPPE